MQQTVITQPQVIMQSKKQYQILPKNSIQIYQRNSQRFIQSMSTVIKQYQISAMEQSLEIFFVEFGLGHHEAGQLIEDFVEFNVVFVLCESLVVAKTVAQFSLAVQQLVQVTQEQFQLADIAAFLVPADALHEDLVDAFEPGDEVSVHVFHLGVLREEFGDVGIGVEVVVAAHEVLSEEDAGVEPAAYLRVDLFGVVHEFLEFLGEGDHTLSKGGEQLFDQVEILVKLVTLDHHGLPLEVVEGHLEVNLLELLHKSFGFFLFVQFHRNTTASLKDLQSDSHDRMECKQIDSHQSSPPKRSTHSSPAPKGTPKSVLVPLQTNFTTRVSLNHSNWVTNSTICTTGISIEGFSFMERKDSSPSPLITTYRSSHFPNTCDFLKILSQIKAPSRNSPNYSGLHRPFSAFKDFTSTRTRTNRMKRSKALVPFQNLSLRLSTISSSLPMLIRTLWPCRPLMVLLAMATRLTRVQERLRLLISKWWSAKSSSVSIRVFLSSSTTEQLFFQGSSALGSIFPFDRLLSTLLMALTSLISS